MFSVSGAGRAERGTAMADRTAENARRSPAHHLDAQNAAGVLAAIAGLGALVHNEAAALRSARREAGGAPVVFAAKADAPEPSNDGKLVHVVGRAEALVPASDNRLNIQA